MKLSKIVCLAVLIGLLAGGTVLTLITDDPAGAVIGFAQSQYDKITQHRKEFLRGFLGIPEYIPYKCDTNNLQIPITRDLHERMTDSVVKINFTPDGAPECNKGRLASGTGVVIFADDAKSFILTNRHIGGDSTQCGQLVQIRDFYMPVPGKTIAIFDKADLSLIQVDIKLTVSPIASSSPAMFEQVVLIGNPLGELWITETGFKSKDELIPVIDSWAQQMTLHTYPGNSGSPVFNLSGEVSSLIFAGYRGMYNMGFSIPLSSIKQFLGDIDFPNVVPQDFHKKEPEISLFMKKTMQSYFYPILVTDGQGNIIQN